MSAGTKAKASARTAPVIAATGTIRGSLQTEALPETRTHGSSARRQARAHGRSRWAERQSTSRQLAPHYGVSASRVRHFASDDPRGPLTQVCAACADPNVDGQAILVAIEEALEDRYMGATRTTLEQRLAYLRSEAEHAAEMRQNMAILADGPNTNDALRAHARALIEMAAIRTRLGLDGDA